MLEQVVINYRGDKNAESYKGMMTYEIKSNALIIRRLSHLYTINTKRLKSITTDTGLRVVFNPSASPRLDLNGESYCLDNIEIYQMKNNKEIFLLRMLHFFKISWKISYKILN